MLRIAAGDGIGIASADGEIPAGTDDLATRAQEVTDRGGEQVAFSSTVNTRVPAGMSVNAAQPQALSRMAMPTPAWKKASCWLSSGENGTSISTAPGSILLSSAANVAIKPCRANVSRARCS